MVGWHAQPEGFAVRGRSSVGRASAFQAEGRGFEPRRPLARVAQSVERVLGKDEVTGSIPVASFRNQRTVTEERHEETSREIVTRKRITVLCNGASRRCSVTMF